MLPGTPFFIASIDKLLNATIAVALAARGALDLDAPLSKYLPEGVTSGLHRWKGSDVTARITVRHLLAHASGLPDWLEDRPRRGRSVVDRVVRDGDAAFQLPEIAAVVRDLKPYFPPQDMAAGRQSIRYSDTNFILLVAILEAVTKRPLPNLHETLLYKPLGMRHTWFAGQSTPLEPTLVPSVLQVEGLSFPIPQLMRSFQGIYSTATDLITFMRGLVRGEAFGDAVPLATMQARWNRFGIPRDRAALRAPNWPIEYGLGIKRFQVPRLFNGLRRMPPVVGHSGSTGTWLFHCPERDLYFAGAVDEVTAGAVPYRLMPRMLRLLRAVE
jgi:D-alanyl-D-alanine carboxypeptidase